VAEGDGFEPSVPGESGFDFAREVRGRLFAGGKRIRDSITGGNRERDLRTGFSIPFRLTLAGMMQFAMKPRWGINYITH